jgi:hypothetical protein
MQHFGKAVLAAGLSALALSAQAVTPIVSNGDFFLANGPSGQAYWGHDGVLPSFTTGVDGLASLTGVQGMYQSVGLTWNTTYTLTFDSYGSGTAYVDLYALDFALKQGSTSSTAPIYFHSSAGTQTFRFTTGAASIKSDPYTHLHFGTTAGTFTFDNISITAVPEPESWALLMAGLAVVGSMKRRRSAAAI